jgi:hypothetical protein
VKYSCRNIPQREENSCFIDDISLKKYSSTYKILHGTFQQILSEDSPSDTDDAQEKAKNEGNDTLQGQSKIIKTCKTSSLVSHHHHHRHHHHLHPGITSFNLF